MRPSPAASPAATSGEPAERGGAPRVDAMARLFARFAEVPGVYARYRETKTIALLVEPLVAEGTLHYARGANGAGRFVRRQTSPHASTVLIEPERLVYAEAGASGELDLSHKPEVRAFVTALMAVLSGRRSDLEAAYEVALVWDDAAGATTDRPWALTLRPRPGKGPGFVARIELRGRGVQVREMTIVEVRGDTTKLELRDVDANRRYTDDERRRLFRRPS